MSSKNAKEHTIVAFFDVRVLYAGCKSSSIIVWTVMDKNTR